MQVVEKRQVRATLVGKALEQVLNQFGSGEAGIHPLRDQAEKDAGVGLRGVQRCERGSVGGERLHAALHAAETEMVAKLREVRVQPAVGAHDVSMRRWRGLVQSISDMVVV